MGSASPTRPPTDRPPTIGRQTKLSHSWAADPRFCIGETSAPAGAAGGGADAGWPAAGWDGRVLPGCRCSGYVGSCRREGGRAARHRPFCSLTFGPCSRSHSFGELQEYGKWRGAGGPGLEMFGLA